MVRAMASSFHLHAGRLEVLGLFGVALNDRHATGLLALRLEVSIHLQASAFGAGGCCEVRMLRCCTCAPEQLQPACSVHDACKIPLNMGKLPFKKAASGCKVRCKFMAPF